MDEMKEIFDHNMETNGKDQNYLFSEMYVMHVHEEIYQFVRVSAGSGMVILNKTWQVSQYMYVQLVNSRFAQEVCDLEKPSIGMESVWS